MKNGSYEDMNSYQFSQNWEQVESLMDYNEEAIQHMIIKLCLAS